MSSKPAREGQIDLSLSWENLHYRIGDRTILAGLNGCALPRRTLGIMGGSGAGKTTLLNALSGRLDSDRKKILSGSVRFNDVPYERRFRQLVGFVPQDDVLAATSTAQKALYFSVRVRRGKKSSEARELVAEVLAELGLTEARHTKIGEPGLTTGLSGGQRKRTSIGVELVAESKLLMLDEPTSGLDSGTGLRLLQTLRRIAQNGRTVVLTIHQPTAAMVKEIDDLLLLAKGHVVYHGPVDGVLNYFSSIGFTCPRQFTPTDYFMTLLQDELISDELIDRWNEYLEAACPGRFARTGEAKPVNGKVSDPLLWLQPVPLSIEPVPQSPPGSFVNSLTHKYVAEYKSARASVPVVFAELMKRAFAGYFLDVQFVIVMHIQVIVFSLIVSWLYNNIKNTTTGIQDRFGLFVMLAVNKSFGFASSMLHKFKPMRALYIREQQSGSYSPFMFFIVDFIAQLPLFLFLHMIEAILVYFITGLQVSAKNFFTFYGAMVMVGQCAVGLGTAIGAGIANPVAASAVLPLIIIPMLLVAPVLATNDQIRPYWYWLEKISFIRHSTLIMMHNEFKSISSISCDVSEFGAACARQPKTGREAIKAWDGSQDQPWVMWLSIVMMFLLVRLLAFVALQIIARSKF